METVHTTPDSLLQLPDLTRRFRLSKSTIYELIQRGEFPAPLKIGARASRWRESEVSAWMAAQTHSKK